MFTIRPLGVEAGEGSGKVFAGRGLKGTPPPRIRGGVDRDCHTDSSRRSHGLQMLGQEEPKRIITPKLITRHFPVDGSRLLYVDGLPMLGQADSTLTFSFKATDRTTISFADAYSNFPSKLGSLMSGEASSIQPLDREARSLSRVDWKGRKKKKICLRWGNRYGPAHECPEGKLIGAKHVSWLIPKS
ncbi:hypothetical protein E3N88_24642 [Mikania micrantha]|uniref:Uncharacterized protein n=1 Tax=Mikania micrantha TaxID=192012 RepID=A0A5N6N2R6_9ASTR|nr:hypothetical protein E3N88_24642 [Mikania micrantha]